jgi:hypothetical protein
MRTWRVHIKRFANMSPWLKAAFARAIKEQPGARYPVVKMADDSPRVFDWVYNWIYAVSFSGLKSAPVPVINDAGAYAQQVQEPEPEESEDDVIITGVRIKVENEAKPLGDPVTDNPTETKPTTDSDEVQEVVADPITPRDLMDLYILALKLEIFSLRNAAIDALHVWFHPDVQQKQKQRPNNRASATNPVSVNSDDDVEEYELSKKLPHRRVPWMTDVRHVFARTPEDNPLRTFLISTAVIYLFSKRPEGRNLPEEWNEVLPASGEIGFCMLRFMSRCRWVAGRNAPRLLIWPKHAFHEAGLNISVD